MGPFFLAKKAKFGQFIVNIAASATELDFSPLFSLPWFRNIILLQKTKDPQEKLCYAQQAVEQGWNRHTLKAQIKSIKKQKNHYPFYTRHIQK